MNINIQHDWKDCGLYCLESFHNYYYGNDVDISELKSTTNYGNKGINILELNTTANNIGLKLESYKLTMEELIAYKNKKPFIALIKSEEYSHYVIIYKKNKDNIYLLDPAKGKYKISREKFEKLFLGIILLVEKTPKITKKTPKKRIFDIFWTQKTTIIFVILLLVMVSVANLISPYFLKLVIDKVIPSHANKFLNFLFIFFSWLMVLKITSSFWTNYIKNKLFLPIKMQIKNQIIDNFRLSDGINVTKISTIDWFRRLDMVDGVVDYYANLISVLTKDIIIMRVSLMFILFIDTKLIYICLFSCSILFVISIIFRNRKRKLIPKLLDSNLKLNLSYFDIFNRHIELKNIQNSKYLINKNKKKLNETVINEYKIKTILNWNMITSEFILQASYILIIFLGSYQLLGNQLTLGNLLIFISMFSLFSSSFHSISNTFLEWTEMKRNTQLIEFVLSMKPEKVNINGIKIQKIRKIHLENVKYKYELGHELLNIDSLNINSSMNLKGRNGAGKTTLFKVLYSYVQCEGKILINDINMKNIDKSFLRNQIFLSGNEWLPNVPFKEFLADDNEKFQLLLKNFKKYKIDQMLIDNNIDISLDIVNNGSQFSMGQKKIIAILPLFAQKYSLLLLDEIFDNIDIQNSKILSKAILGFQKNSIIINISHNNKNIFNFKKEYTIV